MEKQKNGVGRRKEAVTRVFLSKGTGVITVNDKNYKEYFSLVYLQNQVEAPLKSIIQIVSEWAAYIREKKEEVVEVPE